MEKKKLSGVNRKEDLKSRSQDRLFRFLLGHDKVRAAFVRGKHMLKEMRANHELGILETYVLGQGYLAVALMAAGLKGSDRIALKVDCEGSIRGWSVEAHAGGEVRGYLLRKPIPMEKELDSFDLTAYYGPGTLTVTRYPEDAKQPYVGQVKIKYGNLASDLANYYLTSEQTPTAVLLSIKFSSDGEVKEAAGLLVQPLPGFLPEELERLEQTMQDLPSIGDALAGGLTPEAFMKKHFSEYSVRLLGSRRVEFYCRCSKDTVTELLRRFSAEELAEIAEKGPFPLEVSCHNCNTAFSFTQTEIVRLLMSKGG